ncbi:hypothetical protein QF047_003090 [Arthrobacter sp. W4I7]|nr:hypothetical protein [Arthrobacter sp. W4I7]
MTETPTTAAQAWLASLDGALQRRDVDARWTSSRRAATGATSWRSRGT